MNHEIPPPPRTPSISVSGAGWRASIPSAVVIALITTLGTVVSNLTATSPRLDAIEARLEVLEHRLGEQAGSLARTEIEPAETDVMR